MEVFDFKTDKITGGRVIENGDFAIGESTQQHQEDLLMSEKGEWLSDLTAGVGIRSMLLNDSEPDELKVEIQVEFERDGMDVNSLKIDNEFNLKIDANY